MKMWMKALCVTLFLPVCVFANAKLNTHLNNQKLPLGYWLTVNSSGEAQGLVHIFPVKGDKNAVDGELIMPFFKIDSGKKNPPDTLCSRCTGSLKNKALVGLELITTAKKTGYAEGADGPKYTGGTIMDPSNGKKYSLKMWTEDNGEKLRVRGYIWLFYKTQTWYRVTKAFADQYVEKCGIDADTGFYKYLDKNNQISNKKLWSFCSNVSIPELKDKKS